MSNNTSWALSEKGRDYSQAIDPFKAVYALRKQIPGSSSRFCHTEGIACSVFVEKAKKKTICFVTFSDVAKNIHCDQTLTQLHRFSRKHEYRVPTGLTVKRFDRFSFLSMDRDIVGETGINFEVIGLTFRAPKKEELTSNLEAYSFIGSKKLKLKLEFQGNNKKHKLVRSEKDEFVDKYCVIGAPIIVENEEIKSFNSGRWSVLGVVGLSEEGALCPYFVTNEIFAEQEMSVHSSDEEVINDTTGQPAPISGVLQPHMSQTNHDASRPPKKVDEHEVDASDCRCTDAEDQISVHNTQDGVFLDEQREAGGTMQGSMKKSPIAIRLLLKIPFFS